MKSFLALLRKCIPIFNRRLEGRFSVYQPVAINLKNLKCSGFLINYSCRGLLLRIPSDSSLGVRQNLSFMLDAYPAYEFEASIAHIKCENEKYILVGLELSFGSELELEDAWNAIICDFKQRQLYQINI